MLAMAYHSYHYVRLKVVVLFVRVGVKHLCVFINKADMVDDEEILELVSDTFSYHFFPRINYRPHLYNLWHLIMT